MQKNTGIIRNLDKLGRVVIPIEIRNSFELVEKSPIEMFIQDDSIILKKYQPSCIFCDETKNLTAFKNKLICNKCIEKIVDSK